MLLEMVHLHNKIQFSDKFAPKKIRAKFTRKLNLIMHMHNFKQHLFHKHFLLM